MKKSDFTPLGDLLPRAVNHYNLDRQVKGSLMCHHFRKLAISFWNESIGECVQPRSYREGVLNVAVCDSGWAEQVHFKKTALMEGLEAACPLIPLKGLRIKVERFSS